MTTRMITVVFPTDGSTMLQVIDRRRGTYSPITKHYAPTATRIHTGITDASFSRLARILAGIPHEDMQAVSTGAVATHYDY